MLLLLKVSVEFSAERFVKKIVIKVIHRVKIFPSYFFNVFRMWLVLKLNKSSKRIEELRGVLSGEDIYVIASGPSLAEVDASKLAGKNVVTLHYSHSFVDSVVTKSHFWVVAAESRMVDFGDVDRGKFNASFWGPGSLKIFNYPFKFFSKEDVVIPPVYELKSYKLLQYRGFLDRSIKNGINKNYSKSSPQGMSVIFMGIQVAYFLGAKNIYLLGADFGANPQSGNFYFNEDVRIVDSKMVDGIDPYKERYVEYIRPALFWYKNFLSRNEVGFFNTSRTTRDDVTEPKVFDI